MRNNTSTSTELTVITTDQPQSIIIDLNPTIGEPHKRSLDTFKKDKKPSARRIKVKCNNIKLIP